MCVQESRRVCAFEYSAYMTEYKRVCMYARESEHR